MYIISKHRDYYDTALGAGGIDKTLVYERKKEAFKFPVFLEDYLPTNMRRHSDDFEYLEHWRGTKKEPNYRFIIVGFCGKTYVAAQLAWEEKKNPHVLTSEKKTEIIYGEDIIEFFGKKKSPRGGYLWGLKNKDIKANITNLINKYHGQENFLNEIFRKEKVPYFAMELVSKNRWTTHKKDTLVGQLNPVLKDLEFYRVFDPYQAFQEVSMFIGGVLGVGERDTIEISDEHKRASRGFTDMSFKRREHQAKPRRNKKKKK